MPNESNSQYRAPQPALTIGRYNLFLEKLLSGRPLEKLLEELVYLIQERQPECIASVMLVSDDGRSLKHGAAPDLPEFYATAVEGTEIAVGVGCCGTAAATGHLVIAEDVDRHPYWSAHRELAQQAGFAACWSQPIVSGSGKVLGTLALYYRKPRHPTGQDLLLIHESARLAQASIEFRQAENHRVLSEAITLHLPVGLIITDQDFRILEVNPAFSQITGYPADDVLQKGLSAIISKDDQGLSRYQNIISRLPGGKSWSGEVLVSRRNGERFTAELSFTALRNGNDQIERCVALISDISERKQSEEMIQYQASYDLLTSLPNRNLFYERLNWTLEQCRHRDRSFAVMVMDLDYFKEINDTLGHDAGDELLVKVGTRLNQSLPRRHTIARLGGDEFGFIVTTDADRDALGTLANQLLETVSQTISIRQIRDLKISASIGISRFPDDGGTVEQLLKAAEQAAYAAKNEGRNLYTFFTPEMHEEARNQALLHQDMRHAVKDNQLELHYQPIKDLSSGRITQLEALVRWNHPQRGMIPPDLFIPLAEKTGMIREIGEWVRSEALAMAGRLHQQNLLVPIAVNVSTAEFYNHNLAQHIVDQERQANLPPGHLMVEITESLLIRNQQETRNFLTTLQQADIRISLDDFGTGYSSLSYLTSFPADKLKIDRTFIQDMHSDPRRQALVKTIIDLGHSLNMKVIAEGVETDADETLLRGCGCDLIQGYLLARPLPEYDITRFLAGHNGA